MRAGYTGVDAALIPTGANDDEVRQLREALSRALGTTKDGLPQTLDSDYRDGWPALAELGLPAFCVAEDKGGFGFRVDVAVAAAMELGAALHGAPYAGMTAAAHVLAARSDDLTARALLPEVLEGGRVCAFGYLDGDETRARSVDGVTGADALVLARRSGAGTLTFPGRSGWSVEPAGAAFDVTRLGADVTVEPGAGHASAAIGQAMVLHRLLLAADTMGGLVRMLDRTVAYTGQRRAFGRAIGGFQAVQHRLVDHTVRARGMTLLIEEAARQLAAGSAEAGRFVAMADVSVSSGAAHILHDLLQLTGAIGFTWEYGLHLYERRAHQNARLAANPRAAVRHLAGIEGWTHAG